MYVCMRAKGIIIAIKPQVYPVPLSLCVCHPYIDIPIIYAIYMSHVPFEIFAKFEILFLSAADAARRFN